MPTPKRTLPVRAIDPRALLGDLALNRTHTHLSGFAFDDGPRLVSIAHDASAPALVISAHASPPLTHLACDDALLVAATERRIVRIDTRTGALTTLVDTPAAMTTSLLLDDAIYGTVIGPEGGVFRAPREGGSLHWLHRGRATSLAVSHGRIVFCDGARLLCLDPHSDAPRVLVDPAIAHTIVFVDDTLIWTEFTAEGSLRALDLTTGDVRPLASAPFASGLVALGEHLYWAQASRRKTDPWLWRVRRDGRSAPQPLLKGGCKRAVLAGHGHTLAWCGGNDGGAFTLDVTALTPRE